MKRILLTALLFAATQEKNFPEFKNIFSAAAPEYNWIGRPPFNGDNYLRNTQVSDFRIYNIAISDKQLKRLAASYVR